VSNKHSKKKSNDGFWSSNFSLFTDRHDSESRAGWDTKYSDNISSFLCYVLFISIAYYYLGYCLTRESRGNRRITLHLLYMQCLYYNGLQKAEMSPVL